MSSPSAALWSKRGCALSQLVQRVRVLQVRASWLDQVAGTAGWEYEGGSYVLSFLARVGKLRRLCNRSLAVPHIPGNPASEVAC